MEHVAVNIDHYKKVLDAKSKENKIQKGYHPVYGLFDIDDGIEHPLIGKEIKQNTEYYLSNVEFDNDFYLNSNNHIFDEGGEVNINLIRPSSLVENISEYEFKVKTENGITYTVKEIIGENFTVKKVFLSYSKHDSDGYGYYLKALIENQKGSTKTIAFQNIDCTSEYVLNAIEQTQEKYTFLNY